MQLSDKNLKLYRTVYTAMFIAMAIVLNIVDGLLPKIAAPFPLHYGLANFAVMAAMIYVSLSCGLAVAIGKSLFVLLTRGLTAFVVSITGTIAAYICVALLLMICGKKISLYLLSLSGALLHNLGQLAAFSLLLHLNFSIYKILPLLLVHAVIAGALTALLLQTASGSLQKALGAHLP